jgi:hypothetical protein
MCLVESRQAGIRLQLDLGTKHDNPIPRNVFQLLKDLHINADRTTNDTNRQTEPECPRLVFLQTAQRHTPFC